MSYVAYAGPELWTSGLTGVQSLSQGQASFDLVHIDRHSDLRDGSVRCVE